MLGYIQESVVMRKNLKEALHDWTDIDFALGYLGKCLGVVDSDNAAAHGGELWLFCTVNPLVESLHAILDMLVRIGVLETRTEGDFQYRWNPCFSYDDVKRQGFQMQLDLANRFNEQLERKISNSSPSQPNQTPPEGTDTDQPPPTPPRTRGSE